MHTQWSDELVKELAAPFPATLVKTKTLGGKDITFVSWYDYVEKLNRLVGPEGWHCHAHFHDAGGRLVCATPVTILGVTKTNVGDESEEAESFGSPSVNAYAQALKRTLALFGMGLDMYQKKRPQPSRPQPPKPQYGGPSRHSKELGAAKAEAKRREGAADDPIITGSGIYAGKHLSDVDDVDWLRSWYGVANAAWQKRIARRLDELGARVPEE